MKTSGLLKRIIAMACLLAVLLSQGQLLFACELMDGKPVTACCCDGDMSDGCANGGGCVMPGSGAGGAACCTISMDTPSEVAMGAPGAASNVCLLKAPQPPPALVFSPIANRLRPAPAKLSFSFPPSASASGEALYLLTRRIRI